MRRILWFVALLCPLTLLFTAMVFGWGATAHKFINGKAVISLPNSMASFKADSLFFVAHARSQRVGMGWQAECTFTGWR